ncbi:hypothetical protein [Aliarcobacter butzleri]|uniref:hypothetical protein n=1 Tax=Aliarcobacter butzleri TaxID=28197 RepID=UPI003AFB6C7C
MNRNTLTIFHENSKYTIKIPTKDNLNFSEFDMSDFINKFKKSDTNESKSVKYNNDDLTFVAQDKNMKIKLFFIL